MEDEAVEVFGVLFLTTKQRLIGYHEIDRGTIDSTIVHPRELFRAALMAHAASIVVGHNHPNGEICWGRCESLGCARCGLHRFPRMRFQAACTSCVQ